LTPFSTVKVPGHKSLCFLGWFYTVTVHTS
jgi:hypothetical protein